jgi:hypothetical protein
MFAMASLEVLEVQETYNPMKASRHFFSLLISRNMKALYSLYEKVEELLINCTET